MGYLAETCSHGRSECQAEACLHNACEEYYGNNCTDHRYRLGVNCVPIPVYSRHHNHDIICHPNMTKFIIIDQSCQHLRMYKLSIVSNYVLCLYMTVLSLSLSLSLSLHPPHPLSFSPLPPSLCPYTTYTKSVLCTRYMYILAVSFTHNAHSCHVQRVAGRQDNVKGVLSSIKVQIANKFLSINTCNMPAT